MSDDDLPEIELERQVIIFDEKASFLQPLKLPLKTMMQTNKILQVLKLYF